MKFSWLQRKDAHTSAKSGSVLTQSDVDKAYERGRRDGRRRGLSFLSSMVGVAALIGVGMIYLAVHEGSFAGGGDVVDHKIATATGGAMKVGHKAILALNGAGHPDAPSSPQTASDH